MKFILNEWALFPVIPWFKKTKTRKKQMGMKMGSLFILNGDISFVENNFRSLLIHLFLLC